MKNICFRSASFLTMMACGIATGYSAPDARTAEGSAAKVKAVENKTVEVKAVEAKAAVANGAETKVSATKATEKTAKEEYVYITVTGSNIPKKIKKSDIAAGKLPKDVQMQLMDKEQLGKLHSAPMKGN